MHGATTAACTTAPEPPPTSVATTPKTGVATNATLSFAAA